MSALGQKQTCATQKPMSALAPKATAKADMPQWPCLLYPKSRHVQCNCRCLLWAKSGHRERHPQKTLEPFSVLPEGFPATSTNFRRFASASCASPADPTRRGRRRRAGELPEEAWSPRLWNFVSTGALRADQAARAPRVSFEWSILAPRQ
jgi:hypothetical protein